MSVQEKLKQFMTSKGLPLQEEEFYIDGRIHRYSSKCNGKKDEYYSCIMVDDKHMRCMFGSWKGSQPKHFWNSFGNNELPKYQEKIDEINKKLIENDLKLEKERKDFFKKEWETLDPCLEHPYLTEKKIKPTNLRHKNSILYIPLYNSNGDLTTCIKINPNGQKQYYYGIKAKLMHHPFGETNSAQEIVFCEGYATGRTIYEITNKAVVSCGSFSSICPIAQQYKIKYPNKKLSVALDNDKAGLTVKEDWKKWFNNNIYIPDVEGFDFNDVFCKEGPDKVTKLFTPKYISALNIKEVMEEEVKEEKRLNSILYEGTFNIIFGSGGVGKSRVAYEMAYSLCSGEKFLYFEPYGKYKTLYVDGEMTGAEIKDRIKDLILRHNESEFDPNNFKMIKAMDILNQTGEDLDLFQEEHRAKLNQSIEKADVIFLDNLGSLTVPPDGDSFKLDKLQWIKMFNWIKEWRAKGKTFVLIMHANKDGRLEGVGKIRNDADLVLEIKKPIDLDTSATLHFEVFYDKARKIPVYLQQPFSARIMPNHKRSFGWFGTKL